MKKSETKTIAVHNLIEIENKKTKVVKKVDPITDKPIGFLSYADMINICAGASDPVRGCVAAEMKIRLRIMDACEAATKTIKIDRMWIPVLKKSVEETNWNVIHEDIVTFTDFIKEIVQ